MAPREFEARYKKRLWKLDRVHTIGIPEDDAAGYISIYISERTSKFDHQLASLSGEVKKAEIGITFKIIVQPRPGATT